MYLSYSAVDTFKQCPRKFQLRYIDKVEVERDILPNDALLLGIAMEDCIRHGYPFGMNKYKKEFWIYNNDNITWEMIIGRWHARLSNNYKYGIFQYKIQSEEDEFLGYVDYINPEKTEVVDFKFCNAKKQDEYGKSIQLQVYMGAMKEYTDLEINSGYYLTIPKPSVPRKDMDDLKYRREMLNQMENLHAKKIYVSYDDSIWKDFKKKMEEIRETTEFEIKENSMCYFCEYKGMCSKSVKKKALKMEDYNEDY